MRAIGRSAEPTALRSWRRDNSDATDWTELPGEVKQAIRDELCTMQQGLCAYCQSRLRQSDGRTRIEHWSARAPHPERTFDWSNLLGVCVDGDSEQAQGLYCERARGKRPLAVDPSDPRARVDERVRYLTNGEILIDGDVHHDDVPTLNLNHLRLRENRRLLHGRLAETLGAPVTVAALRRHQQRWRQGDAEGNLPEFAGVAEFFLARWIRALGELP